MANETQSFLHLSSQDPDDETHGNFTSGTPGAVLDRSRAGGAPIKRGEVGGLTEKASNDIDGFTDGSAEIDSEGDYGEGGDGESFERDLTSNPPRHNAPR